KLGLTMKPIAKDGNCGFHALADHLEWYDHEQLRRMTVHFMHDRQELYEKLAETTLPFDDYLNEMEKSGTYIDYACFHAFARMMMVSIIVHIPGSPPTRVAGISFHKQLHLAFVNKNHYNSVRKLGAKSGPADVSLELDDVHYVMTDGFWTPVPKPSEQEQH